jgi:hypothetical protein
LPRLARLLPLRSATITWSERLPFDRADVRRWATRHPPGLDVLIQLGIHHIPAAQVVFEIGPLSAADCALTVLVAMGPVTVIEVATFAQRWNGRGAVGAVA